ncbi:MAG: hypothetical protein Q7J38_10825 [Gallionella sp.]|nr:hypothetical protein [Gallionella sp.]
MPIEDDLLARISQLLNESGSLSKGDENDQCVDARQRQLCSAWLTAVQNAAHLACSDPHAPYRLKVDKIATSNRGFCIHTAVGELAAVLQSFLADAGADLLASVADQARAEVFDDFLDHADAYLRNKCKNEAGVIAGVVFEDTVRRICRKHAIAEKGQNLDALISVLASRNELTAVKAKRARAAADVRTKATHAQWAEFELSDVQATVEFTREFIGTKLDA